MIVKPDQRAFARSICDFKASEITHVRYFEPSVSWLAFELRRAAPARSGDMLTDAYTTDRLVSDYVVVDARFRHGYKCRKSLRFICRVENKNARALTSCRSQSCCSPRNSRSLSQCEVLLLLQGSPALTRSDYSM